MLKVFQTSLNFPYFIPILGLVKIKWFKVFKNKLTLILNDFNPSWNPEQFASG